jgi:hypothetical protein
MKNHCLGEKLAIAKAMPQEGENSLWSAPTERKSHPIRGATRTRSLQALHVATLHQDNAMKTFNVHQKTLAGLTNMKLTKRETENIVQIFSLSVLDWRDAKASDWFVNLLNQHGADHMFSALTRVRRLAGRDRGFWWATAAMVNPKHHPLIKNPPDMSNDEVWRFVYQVFLDDEKKQTIQRVNDQLMEEALNQQV